MFTIGERFGGKESVCMITGNCIILGDECITKLCKVICAVKNKG